jgi:hypothetical protein
MLGWIFLSKSNCFLCTDVNYSFGFVQCDAYTASASSEITWTIRTTFPEYVVALSTIVGSVFFSVCSVSLLPLHSHSVFHTVVLSSPIDLFVVICWTLIKLSYLILYYFIYYV